MRRKPGFAPAARASAPDPSRGETSLQFSLRGDGARQRGR
jgi:hypothetical protein